MAKLVKRLCWMFILAILIGCEANHGIYRGVVLDGLPDVDCIGAAIESVEGIRLTGEPPEHI